MTTLLKKLLNIATAFISFFAAIMMFYVLLVIFALISFVIAAMMIAACVAFFVCIVYGFVWVVSRVVRVARVAVKSLTTTINHKKPINIKKETKPTKSVRFGNVHVRNYQVVRGTIPFNVAGKSPWCEGGAPLSLGWKYDVDDDENNVGVVTTVDAYEDMRLPVRRTTFTRKGRQYIAIASLSCEERIEVLMAHGYQYLPVPNKVKKVLITKDDYNERWAKHEEEQRLSHGTKIRFGDVHIRSHTVVPGDHPKSKYCPVSLGWEYNSPQQQQLSVHEYEALRAPKRCKSRSEMRYTKEERATIWKDNGCCHWEPKPQSSVVDAAKTTTTPLRRSARIQAQQLDTAEAGAPLRRSARLQQARH